MASLFKPLVVRYVLYVDAKGRPVSKDTPGAKRQRVSKDTPGAVREQKRASKWYGRFIGADGLEKREPLDKNKDLAHEMLAELVKAARREAAGLADPFEQHRKRPLSEHLDDFRRALDAKDDTPEHVETTLARLRAVFDGCGFRKLTDLDANRVADWLKDARQNGKAPTIPETAPVVALSYADIGAHFGVAERTVSYWRKQGAPIKPRGRNDLKAIARWRRGFLKDREGISIATSNHYLTAVKSFSNWLVKARRCPDNPFRHLAALNAKTDVRRERRILPDAEFSQLVNMARTSRDVVKGLAGPDRAMLYITAAYTGLRAGELASLSDASLDLESGLPTAAVAAAYSKRRRRDIQPLRPDLAALLREWLQGKANKAPENRDVVPMRGTGQTSPGRARESQRGKLWPGRWHENAAEMLRHDLDAAGIPYEDTAGQVFDFHALRHQFISNLAAAGVHPKIAQTLARHSTIGLTMDRYTHLAVADVAGALDGLPALPGNLAAGELQATGTGGAADCQGVDDLKTTPENDSGGPVFMRMVAPTSGFSCLPMSVSGQEGELSEGKKKRPNPNESKGLGEFVRSCPELSQARPTGLEPATTGSTVQYSNQLSYGPSKL